MWPNLERDLKNSKGEHLLKDLQIQTRQGQHHLNKGETQNSPASAAAVCKPSSQVMAWLSGKRISQKKAMRCFQASPCTSAPVPALKPALVTMDMGAGQKCRVSGSTPDLMNQNLHFNKSLKGLPSCFRV